MTQTTMPWLRFALWTLIAITGATALGFYLFSSDDTGGVTLADYGGGSFSLVDQTGRAVDETMFVGHPSLLFFGYTNCPDICPTTMAEMIAWLDEIGPAAHAVKAYLVTVDPARDTQEVLASYVDWTEGRVTGVTGSTEELQRMMTAWQVTAEPVPGTGGAYTMDHTASVFLIDEEGNFRGTVAYRESWDTAIAKVRRLVQG